LYTYGGGGSGGSIGNAGGAGAAGIVIITEYISTCSNGLNSASLATSSTFTTPSVQNFTSGSGAIYHVPTGALYLRILMNGGGAGGYWTSTSFGGGGGEGAFIEHILSGPLSSTYIYTIASAVTAVTNGNPTTFSGGSLFAGGGKTPINH
jgi:hypothetical protein